MTVDIFAAYTIIISYLNYSNMKIQKGCDTLKSNTSFINIEFARKLSLAYNAMCRPLCQELNLPQTAFDILMFLANNPAYRTASDIVEVRKLKANLVSVNVDRLVREGYLTRQAVDGDRRKVELICTDRASNVISRGQQLQRSFMDQLLAGMDANTRSILNNVVHVMEDNIDNILNSQHTGGQHE